MENPELKTQAERLKHARKHAGYKTAKSFVETFELNQATYSAHETGRNGITVKVAEKYATLLNVDPNWLLTGKRTLSEENEEYLPVDSHVYNIDGFVARSNRVDFVHSIYGQSSIAFLKRAGLRPGMKVVDFGCYNCSVSFWLANFVGEDGKVVAVHDQPEILTQGITRARIKKIDNLEIHETELNAAGKYIQGADMIYCRLNLYRLPHPEKLLAQMIEALPKGGIIAIEEPSLSECTVVPPSASFDKAKKIMLADTELRHVCYDYGNNLYLAMKNAGLKHLKVFTHQPAVIEEYEKRLLEYISVDFRSSYIENELITERAFDKLIKDLDQLALDDNTLMYYPRMTQVCGIKA